LERTEKHWMARDSTAQDWTGSEWTGPDLFLFQRRANPSTYTLLERKENEVMAG